MEENVMVFFFYRGGKLGNPITRGIARACWCLWALESLQLWICLRLSGIGGQA
jgi:hypothetical protein